MSHNLWIIFFSFSTFTIRSACNGFILSWFSWFTATTSRSSNSNAWTRYVTIALIQRPFTPSKFTQLFVSPIAWFHPKSKFTSPGPYPYLPWDIRPDRIYLPSLCSQWRKYEWEKGKISSTGGAVRANLFYWDCL